MSKSQGLSTRITKYNQHHTLVDDSVSSECTLKCAINRVFLEDPCRRCGVDNVWINSKISLTECMQLDEQLDIPAKYDTCYMKPDGGIVWIKQGKKNIPILIAEDKVQGTNDTRHEQKLKKQSTGNAIERAAKNIRMAEMIFSQLDFFPYAIFAAGCGFLEMVSPVR